MENKKKPKTTLKEVRKKMKKLTLAEKKQIKQTETKEKEKKEANKQKITQRVRVNVNLGGAKLPPYQTISGIIPSSSAQPQSINFPNSFYNREQNTLLKSINDQLKQKNEPVASTQTFNIPEPRRVEKATPPPLRVESETVSNFADIEDELNQIMQEGERVIKEVNTPEFNLPPQFSEKIAPPPIIITPPTEKIPIVNKPIEKSGLTFLEQLKQKTEERSRQEEKTPEYIEVVEEERKQERTNPKYKRLTEEEKKQKAEEKRIINQEKERVAEIEKRRRINEAENAKIQKEIDKTETTERALNILLTKVEFEEGKKLQEAYDTGFFKDKEIKAYFKKLKYSPEQIKRIFSKPE